jgi:glycosyltransferase involved in cell wall biosynthesis
MIAAAWNVPVVLFVADPWPDSAVALGVIEDDSILVTAARRVEAWSYRWAALVTVPTRGMVEHMVERKHVPRRKVAFLPNGVDLDLFRPRDWDPGLALSLGIRADDLVVLYAGTVGEGAALEQAVHAMAHVVRDIPEARLVVVGAGGARERVIGEARRVGLDSALFLPPRPVGDVARLWSLASVGLSTMKRSSVAGMTRPAKVLASLGSAVPVVYAGEGEGARLIEEADAGLVVPPENPTELAHALTKLLRDPKLRQQLGAHGRSYAERHLGWEPLVEGWIDSLRAIPSLGSKLA